ncbi:MULTISPECIES: hypothetical protein [unclassified Pseudomonas]|uniref:hypothetical protein n=1 Tax=unclassified Pseudomonas TaxID=196821 RepID=UPI00200D661E|nr:MULTISPECIES: hypothetical protein [unclassified Pseudomonas]
MLESFPPGSLPSRPLAQGGKLLFDPDLNHYEISGGVLNKDSLIYLETVRRTLKKYDVSLPGLYLQDREIYAVLGEKAYLLGRIYTQGVNERRIIYPCFRDGFVFDFMQEISTFSLWKEMTEESKAEYADLKSKLIKAPAAEEQRINFVLTQDFTTQASLEGGDFRGKKEELGFLNGLLSLYQVGVAQARMRALRGVVLTDAGVSATKNSRRKRAVGHSLNLLVGDDVADIRLYQVIASQSVTDRASMQLLSTYYRRWKGRIKTRKNFIDFLSAINLRSIPLGYLSELHQLTALREHNLAQTLLSLPNVNSAEWRRVLLSVHEEFTTVRGRILAGILSPGARPYLTWDAAYTLSNSRLLIGYASSTTGGLPFDGVVNIIGHGIDIESRVLGDAEKVAGWLYSNLLASYAEAGFKKLKVVNFQSCHISQSLATHITLLLLEKALPHFETDKIPNVLVVSSPTAPLVLTAEPPLGHLSSRWQAQYLVFPGHVLKAFRYLINTYPTIQLAVKEHFEWPGHDPDLSNPSFIEYLRSTNVLKVSRISPIAGSELENVSLRYLRGVVTEYFNVRQRGVDEYNRLISEHFPESVDAIRSLVTVASIAEGSQLLPVGEVKTIRKVVFFLASLKLARARRDFVGGYNLYTSTKLKFLIDPYDPVGPLKIRSFTDVIFRLCGSPVPSSETNYQLAYRKMFLLDKQDYFEMTNINIDAAAREFFKNIPYVNFTPAVFHSFQEASPQSNTIVVDAALRQGLVGSEQFGVSTRDLRAVLESGEENRILPAIDQLENSLKRKKALVQDSMSLRSLQETQENLGRAKTAIEKKQLSPVVLKATARVAAGSSRLLGAFGVFVDFRTQPFHLDFSSVKSGLFTTSDSLAVIKGVFDFTSDIGPVLALRLASSASRALWQPRLDHLFFKMNKVLLPLDVLFTAVSLYRNVEGARLAKTAEEQALYITMTVIDGASFGVSLAGFILIGVPGVGVALILVGMALAVVNILLNAIVSLAQLENYRWDEKVGLFFSNLFGASTLPGILTQQQMRQAADRLFEGNADHTQGAISSGLSEEGIDLLLTPMINDVDDQDQTNPIKDIGMVSQDTSVRQQPRGYTLSPSGLTSDDLTFWTDAKDKEKTEQVHKGWYLRRREARRGRERKLMVTMPSTPSTRLEVLDFGPTPTILLFGATPHLLLEANPFGWAAGESPQEQALNKYQVRLHPETAYTLQFKKSVLTSKDFDSNFGSQTELTVPEGAFLRLPQVSLDLSGQEDARETLAELDLSLPSLEVVKFKDKSTFRLDLVNAADHGACALEQVVRTVQLPAYIRFKSGEIHPVMAVVGEGSRITLRNSTGRSLLLLRREVRRCEIEIQASVSGFAVSV